MSFDLSNKNSNLLFVSLQSNPADGRYTLLAIDFNGNKNSLRLLSIHPGVSLDEIEENTGFEFEIFSESISEIPTKTELKLIRNILDPSGIRENIFGAKK